jgi:endonuclease/exonuclease/phosphatase (EEP) superfamily protein YafD
MWLIILWSLTGILVSVTIIPMLDTNIWWIRLMDFPRLQIGIAGVAILVAGLFAHGPNRLLVPVLMIAVCGYQAWRIFPYTTFHRLEMELAVDAQDSVKILSSNVLMENDRHGNVLDMIARFDPDILFLMETDQRWLDALAPALRRYDTVVSEPLGNHYGMVFATRLGVDDARVAYLTESDTPTLVAQLRGPDDKPFRFVGLHPRPPVPGQNTQERDAQIYYAARFARKADMPVIATGDFNDVAWSDTSQTFKHVGQYLDPRIGRGFFASFDARKFWLRFPIDQVYVTEDVAVVSIRRLEFIGSDHFPMATTISLDPGLAKRLNTTPPPISKDEQALIDRSIRKTREMLGHGEM